MAVPAPVLSAYGFDDDRVEPIIGGLINQTYRVTRGQQPIAVLQRLHAIFAPEVNRDLDAITALSGSGPAYFFLFMEAMIDSGIKLGLDRDTATQLAMQTGLGSASMAIEDEADLVELRRRVTSPGGTTQAAIERFEADGLRTQVDAAMQAAFDRAQEMAREMG